jgi:hypothetical protein
VVEEWVSLREFARRRGVSLQAVQKAIASGRVTAVRRADSGPDGQPGRITGIEVNQATAQWNRNTDPNEAAKSGKVIPAPAAAQAPIATDEQHACGLTGFDSQRPTPGSDGHGARAAQPAVVLQSQPSLLDPAPMVAGAPTTPGASAGGSDDQAPGTRPADATPNPAPETVIAAAGGLTGQPDSRPPSRHDAPPGRGAPAAGDALQAGPPGMSISAPSNESAKTDTAIEPPPDAPANSEYYSHRSRREEFSAKTAELDYLEKIGALVPVAGVRRAIVLAARALREAQAGLASSQAPLLAAERDPVRVDLMLTREIARTQMEFTTALGRSLDELTRGTAAAGGPGLSE